MENLLTDTTLHNIVCGAVNETIRVHGNITGDLVTSVAKRVVGTFRGTIVSHINQFGYDKLAVDAYQVKIEQLKSENHRLAKKIKKLHKKSRKKYLDEQEAAKQNSGNSN